MNKIAVIQAETSPCEMCGQPSVTVLDGIPLCGGCKLPKRFQTRPEAIAKVAADLTPLE